MPAISNPELKTRLAEILNRIYVKETIKLTNISLKFGNADFKKIMEEESGLNLDYFFEQWFYRAGAPEFAIDYSVSQMDWYAHFDTDAGSRCGIPANHRYLHIPEK